GNERSTRVLLPARCSDPTSIQPLCSGVSMSKVDRRSVLVGSVAGATVGAAGGYLAGALREMSRTAPTNAGVDNDVNPSYAQQGEDLVVKNVLAVLGISTPSYLDIGAHHPVKSSNTYLFYRGGGRGVLVEPNPTYVKLLREQRKED